MNVRDHSLRVVGLARSRGSRASWRLSRGFASVSVPSAEGEADCPHGQQRRHRPTVPRSIDLAEHTTPSVNSMSHGGPIATPALRDKRNWPEPVAFRPADRYPFLYPPAILWSLPMSLSSRRE